MGAGEGLNRFYKIEESKNESHESLLSLETKWVIAPSSEKDVH